MPAANDATSFYIVSFQYAVIKRNLIKSVIVI